MYLTPSTGLSSECVSSSSNWDDPRGPRYQFVVADNVKTTMQALIPGKVARALLALFLLEWRECYGEHEYAYQVRNQPWLHDEYYEAEELNYVSPHCWSWVQQLLTISPSPARAWLASIKIATVRPLLADLVGSLLLYGADPTPDQRQDIEQQLRALGLIN